MGIGGRGSTAAGADTTAGGAADRSRRIAFIAPRHPDNPRWPWVTQIAPFNRHEFTARYIDNTWLRWPRASRPYVRWQHLKALGMIRGGGVPPHIELAYLFSTDIVLGMTRWPAGWLNPPPRVYVGFTQDGPWPDAKVRALGRAMRQLTGVTVFSNEERDIYLERYGLDPARTHLISIHTDDTQGYVQYGDDVPPLPSPDGRGGARLERKGYVLAMGSPNRRFKPVAVACKALGIPLVIITRPWHTIDSLAELAELGAIIITDADRMKSLTYLKHARLAVMAFDTDRLPGAFTTLIHAMFLRTPFVVTRCLGITDYVIDGETGSITPHIPPGADATWTEQRALTEAIERLWKAPGEAARMGDAGYERAVRLYSREAAARAFDALTGQLLGKS